ncbi:hypothetical protein HDV00_010047 [Rhizophlyctis rosea]|nr:hypothetical protein HDV00_010047 [Rhizophlyctis rosea]
MPETQPFRRNSSEDDDEEDQPLSNYASARGTSANFGGLRGPASEGGLKHPIQVDDGDDTPLSSIASRERQVPQDDDDVPLSDSKSRISQTPSSNHQLPPFINGSIHSGYSGFSGYPGSDQSAHTRPISYTFSPFPTPLLPPPPLDPTMAATSEYIAALVTMRLHPYLAEITRSLQKIESDVEKIQRKSGMHKLERKTEQTGVRLGHVYEPTPDPAAALGARLHEIVNKVTEDHVAEQARMKFGNAGGRIGCEACLGRDGVGIMTIPA